MLSSFPFKGKVGMGMAFPSAKVNAVACYTIPTQPSP